LGEKEKKRRMDYLFHEQTLTHLAKKINVIKEERRVRMKLKIIYLVEVALKIK
jgi:hypothetical protein